MRPASLSWRNRTGYVTFTHASSHASFAHSIFKSGGGNASLQLSLPRYRARAVITTRPWLSSNPWSVSSSYIRYKCGTDQVPMMYLIIGGETELRLFPMQSVMGIVRYTHIQYEKSHANATLADRYASLDALQYNRACLNFEIPDLVSSTSFMSKALPDVSSDAPQSEGVSPDNLIIDGSLVTFCDHGLEFVPCFTG
jgi:hypothetical protein